MAIPSVTESRKSFLLGHALNALIDSRYNLDQLRSRGFLPGDAHDLCISANRLVVNAKEIRALANQLAKEETAKGGVR